MPLPFFLFLMFEKKNNTMVATIIFFCGCITMKKVTTVAIVLLNGFVAKKAMTIVVAFYNGLTAKIQ
jgi:hypothetical protein